MDLVEYRIIELDDKKSTDADDLKSSRPSSINKVICYEEKQKPIEDSNPSKWVSVKEVMRFDAPTIVST